MIKIHNFKVLFINKRAVDELNTNIPRVFVKYKWRCVFLPTIKLDDSELELKKTYKFKRSSTVTFYSESIRVYESNN